MIGWSGSFRAFHRLDILIEAFAKVMAAAPNARLLLVGDGQERQHIEALVRARELDTSVVFTGKVSHEAVPTYLRAMDIAAIPAGADSDFHYSPLKLREFMACGVPTVAPQLGEMGREFGEEATPVQTYRPGDVDGFADEIIRLVEDRSALRRTLGEQSYAYERGTRRLQPVPRTLSVRS